MDQKQAEAAGNLMPATASEIERSSTKVEFFDPSKDEGKEILLYQPDSSSQASTISSRIS